MGLGGVFQIPLLLLRVNDSECVTISQERVPRSAPENSRLQGSVRAPSPHKPRVVLSPPCGRKGAAHRLCPQHTSPRPPSLSVLLLPSQLRAASSGRAGAARFMELTSSRFRHPRLLCAGSGPASGQAAHGAGERPSGLSGPQPSFPSPGPRRTPQDAPRVHEQTGPRGPAPALRGTVRPALSARGSFWSGPSGSLQLPAPSPGLRQGLQSETLRPLPG